MSSRRPTWPTGANPCSLWFNGEPIGLCVEREDESAYREMTQRLAGDPVGQTIVFEFMVRLFFVNVLASVPSA